MMGEKYSDFIWIQYNLTTRHVFLPEEEEHPGTFLFLFRQPTGGYYITDDHEITSDIESLETHSTRSYQLN